MSTHLSGTNRRPAPRMGAGRGELPLWAVLVVSAGVLILGFRGGEQVVRAGGACDVDSEGVTRLAAAEAADGREDALTRKGQTEPWGHSHAESSGRASLTAAAASDSANGDVLGGEASGDPTGAGSLTGWPEGGPMPGEDGSALGSAGGRGSFAQRVASLPDAFGLYEVGSFESGVRHGAWQTRRKDGSVYKAGRYEHGLHDGVWETYASDGQVLTELGYSSGSRHGHFREYSQDGVLMQDGQYQDNDQSGDWTTYYSDGRIKERGRFENGLQEGPWEFYDDLGIPTTKAGTYHAGVRIGDL